MRYGSVCSGIEAATLAWHSLGWKPAFFSEIEKFPREVLKYHYPDIPLHGDFTTIGKNDYGSIDLLVGGTPCQSFSIAGLRGGMDDDRGNLALEYLKLAKRKRPQWLVWENVPGVRSSWSGEPDDDSITEWEESSDFACFIEGLSELGYGYGYRSFDAQYFGLAQRRQRVFLVGYLGDWRPAAAVLFERESLLRDSAPRREKRQTASGRIARSLAIRGREGIASAELGEEVANAILTPSGGRGGIGVGAILEENLTAYGGNNTSGPIEIATAVKGDNSNLDFESETFIAHTLRGNGFDASEDGTGRGTPIISVHGTQDPDVLENLAHPLGRNNGAENAIAFDTTQITSKENRSRPSPGEPCHTLNAGSHAPAIAISGRARGDDGRGYARPEHFTEDCAGTVDASKPERVWAPNSLVRRLTPLECERLQGCPDNYTQIAWRGNPADKCPDGPRYKAIGNSMAVPVMHWIGKRIDMVSKL